MKPTCASNQHRYEKLPKGFLQRTLEREAASSAITKARLRNEEEIWWRNATKKEIDEREQEEAKVRGTYTLALRDPRVYL